MFFPESVAQGSFWKDCQLIDVTKSDKFEWRQNEWHEKEWQVWVTSEWVARRECHGECQLIDVTKSDMTECVYLYLLITTYLYLCRWGNVLQAGCENWYFGNMHAAKSYYTQYFGHTDVVSRTPFIVNNSTSWICMPPNRIICNKLALVVCLSKGGRSLKIRPGGNPTRKRPVRS